MGMHKLEMEKKWFVSVVMTIYQGSSAGVRSAWSSTEQMFCTTVLSILLFPVQYWQHHAT